MTRILWLLLLLLGLPAAGCREQVPLDLEALAGQARGGDAAACRTLIGQLGDGKGAVNDRIYAMLLDLGPSMGPYLLEQVEAADRIRREHVIAALGALKVGQAVAPLSEVLARKNLGRRYVAAWALGEIRDAAAIPALIAALDDDDAEVRKYATRSLIKLNRPAVEPLLASLATASPRRLAGAIRALGDMADPRALEGLLAQVSGSAREEVFSALGKLKDPRAGQALIAGLSDDNWKVRMNAAMALGPVGGETAVAPLQRALEDEVHVVREWSARSLEMITGNHVKYRNEQGEYVAPYSIYH